MNSQLIELGVENFRSLREVSVELGPLNVLVGPNGAGKSNLLEVFRFLADVIRVDLQPAFDIRGGYGEVAFWGGEGVPDRIRINVKASWTAHSSRNHPDVYELDVAGWEDILLRRESFEFRSEGGRRHKISVSGERLSFEDIDRTGTISAERQLGISSASSALSTLPRLSDGVGEREVAVVAKQLASFRVFDVRADAARKPSRFPRGEHENLEDDASNLAGFLLNLRTRSEIAWQRLVDDAMMVLPQLEHIDFEFPSGAAREVITVLHERGLRRPTQLADASYGTIRLLGLLALLYDPDPPALTCIEEIDHGLHPQALELLVERLRDASERSQFLIATHSPAFANRLAPDELIICERRDDGSSSIPAITTNEVARIVDESEGLPLGDLWFSGALGGDL